jgi:hypothetical protein
MKFQDLVGRFPDTRNLIRSGETPKLFSLHNHHFCCPAGATFSLAYSQKKLKTLEVKFAHFLQKIGFAPSNGWGILIG